MKVIEVERRAVEEPLLYQPVPVLEANVHSPTILVEGDDPVMLVDRYAGDLAAYRRAVLAYPIEPAGTRRGGGVANASRIFGYSGANALLRRMGCMACLAASEAPEAHAAICGAADTLADQLMDRLPGRAEADRVMVRAKVLPEWLLGKRSPWSSGVVNRTSPLPYHRDRNNFSAWSAMVCLRRGVRGGYLHLPEYDVTVECRDGDVVFFNGGDIIHGVTPMRKQQPDGYRYTSVYYPVRKMGRCLPFAEEVARARRSRSIAEDTLLARQRDEGLLQL